MRTNEWITPEPVGCWSVVEKIALLIVPVPPWVRSSTVSALATEVRSAAATAAAAQSVALRADIPDFIVILLFLEAFCAHGRWEMNRVPRGTMDITTHCSDFVTGDAEWIALSKSTNAEMC